MKISMNYQVVILIGKEWKFNLTIKNGSSEFLSGNSNREEMVGSYKNFHYFPFRKLKNGNSYEI